MANLDLVLSISVIIMIVINIIFSYQDYSDFWGLEDYGPLRFIVNYGLIIVTTLDMIYKLQFNWTAIIHWFGSNAF